MPRIRTIKPSFWTDKKIIRLSRDARLFFIALWNFADDNGVVEADPLQLKALIFPVDSDIGMKEIECLLAELEKIGLIRIYEVDGNRYLWIINFLKHQKIDRPRKSNLPLPEEVVKGSYKKKNTSTLNTFTENTSAITTISQTELSESAPGNGTSELNTSQNLFSSPSIFNNGTPNGTQLRVHYEKVDLNPDSSEKSENSEKTIQSDPFRIWTAPEKLETTTIPEITSPESRSSEQTEQTRSGQKPKKSSEQNMPNCPYEEIVTLYNEILPELPQVKVLNKTRKAYLRTRWREVLVRPELLNIFVPSEEIIQKNFNLKEIGLLWFKRYFEYVRESDFLCGRVEPSGNRTTPFVADFEWLIRPANFAKVLEGRYHRKSKNDLLSQLSPNAKATALAALSLIQELKEEEEKRKEEGNQNVVH